MSDPSGEIVTESTDVAGGACRTNVKSGFSPGGAASRGQHAIRQRATERVTTEYMGNLLERGRRIRHQYACA
jgi:hypothetical protein